MPIPDKRDLIRFCEIDGWTEISTKRKDHRRFRKQLSDGRLLRTRVSLGRGPAFDDPGLWRHVLRDQLGLEDETLFWEALKTGAPVQRESTQTATISEPGKEAWLYEFLLHVVGLSEEEIDLMSPEEAMERYLAHVEGG